MGAIGLSPTQTTSVNAAWTSARFLEIRAMPQGTPAQLQAKNLALRQYLDGIVGGQSFIMSSDQVKSVFDKLVTSHEAAISNLVGEPSLEKIVLTSLHYNNPKLIGPGIRNALAQEDPADARAEAWFQIRYDSNGGDHKLSKRRYIESAVFGLYDAQGSVSFAEASSAYRMFTLHRDDILSYEGKYSSSIANANNELRSLNLWGALGVQTLAEALRPAEQEIFATLSKEYQVINGVNIDNFSPLDIYLNPQRASALSAVDRFSAVLDAANKKSNSVLLGGRGDDKLYGGSGNDILIAGEGSQYLNGGAGNDTLIGGVGADILDGGGGTADVFVYTVPSNKQVASEEIRHGTRASIVELSSGVQITGIKTQGVAIKDGTKDGVSWFDALSGTTYYFDKKDGTLTILNGVLGPTDGNKIVIKDFNLADAQSGGYMGIQLGASPVALIPGATENYDPAAPDSHLTLMAGGLATFTLYRTTPGDVAQSYSLALSGSSGSYAVNTGADLLAFQNGAVSVVIPAGQDSVTLALVNIGDPGADESLQLIATAIDPNDPAGSGLAMSNSLTVNYSVGSTNPYLDPATNNNLNAVQLYDASGNPSGLQFNASQQNALDKNNLVTGDGQRMFVNLGGSGNNVVVGSGGNDFIAATGNSGSNVISGGGGEDIIYSGSGTNRIYADTEVSVPTAIAQSKSQVSSGLSGDVIFAGGTADTVVGSSGNDFVYLGASSALVIGGAGNDTILGGVTGGGVGFGWTAQAQWSGAPLTSRMIITPPGLEFSTDGVLTNGAASETYSGRYDTTTYEGVTDAYGKPVGIGDATIFAGSGNDIIGLSNGNNYVDAGTGNSTIFGGMGDNTIFGGTGNVVVIAGGGNDYIDAESGNDYLVGGGGNNTIFAGSGHSTIYAGANGDHWATARTGNNYVQGGSGDAQIYGSGGNDTLIAGDGNSSIWGGAGHEWIVGGDGNNLLVGGTGTNVISAGSGNDTIYAGDGTTTIYGGDGTDVIYGGAGTDVIYAGDGGVAGSPTKIFAGSGDTTIYGGLGVEEIHGGSGNDVIYLGDGGTGDARTVVYAGSGNTTVYGGLGVAEIHGGTGDDVLHAGDGGSSDAPTYVYAGTGHDSLYGGAGVSVLDATASASALIEAGDGDATLLGGAGDDTLIAGTGFDVLDGGAGNNTYVLNSGSGQSEIVQGTGGVNLQFGTGISVGDLGVTATLGSNGGAALEIDGANGSLVVDGGLTGRLGSVSFADSGSISLTQLMRQAGAESTVVQTATGNLVFSVEDGQQLIGGDGQDTISAWGDNDTLVAGSGVTTLFGAGLNDTFVVSHSADVVIAQPGQGATINSSASYVLADNVKTLVLTGSDDLVGTANSLDGVTVIANSGNDTLVGGSGSGKLVGGSGSDTFMLNSGMGTYTAVNNSTLGAVAQLGAGVDLNSVVATRQGNDLQLQIQGSSSSLLLQNYYVNPRAWTIKDANGGTVTQQNLFDVSRLEQQFTAQLEAQDARYYQISGYVQQADGSWYLAPQVSGWFAKYHEIWTASNAFRRNGNSNWESLPTTNGESWTVDPYANGFKVNDYTATVQHTVVTATDDVVYIDDSGTYSLSPSIQAWLPVQWTTGQPYLKNSQYTYYGYLYTDGTVGDQYRQGAVPGVLFSSVTSNVQYVSAQHASDGNLGLLLSDPGIQQTGGTTPAVVQADYTHQYSSYTYQQVNLAPGNHTVYDDYYSSSTTVINAGVGDNTISGGGFVDAGSGNNTISDANIVYTGSGNNSIDDANIVYGGSGNDTIHQVQYYYGGSGNAFVTDAWEYAYAGTGNDTIFAQDSATVYGGSGNDLLIGNGATLFAGTGNDTLLGGQWGADIVIDPTTVKHDLIGAVSDQTQSYNLYENYYQAQGISDWYESYLNPDTYSYWWNGSSPHSPEDAASFFQQNYGVTLEQAVTNGWAYYHAPLPTVVVVPGGLLQPSPYYDSSNVPVITFSADHPEVYSPYLGKISWVDFGAGLSLSDLHFSWGHVTTALSGLSTDPQNSYATLDIDWGTAQSVRVILPNSSDPIGSGIQEFDFADGTKVSMTDMLALAARQADQTVNLNAGDGHVSVAMAGITSLKFGDGIAAGDISISRAGRDLVLTDRTGANQWTLANWYADPAHVGAASVAFGDGTVWGANYLTDIGLRLDGSVGNQNLVGLSDFANVFTGGPGDTIVGGLLNDSVIAGEGDNNVSLSAGDNLVILANGKNTVTVADGINAIYLGDGNNTVAAGNGANTIGVGAGSNSITTGDGDNVVYAGRGSGNNVITVGAGSNLITVGDGQNTVVGGGGNDTVWAGAGGNNITLGDGLNTVGTGDGNNVIVLGKGSSSVAVGNGINQIYFGDGNDTINAGSGDNAILGGAGNNAVYVGNGANHISLGAGNDTVGAGTGNNVIDVGDGDNVVYAGHGTGSNTITFGGGRNVITVGDGSNTVSGADGSDTVWAGGGDNHISVGNGADTVGVGDGANVISVGNGDSAVYVGNGNNRVTLGTGNNAVSAGAGNNVLTATDGNNNIWMGAGNDQIQIGGGNNTIGVGSSAASSNAIQVGDGTNSIAVAAGTNDIRIGNGVNTIQTGNGVNTIHLGSGQATLTNYGGQDSVYIASTVHDDQLWLSQDGSDLLLTVDGTASSLRLTDWFAGATHATIVAGDGHQLIDSQVDSLVQAMAQLSPPPMGQTTLTQQQQDSLMPVIASSWR